MKISTQPSLKTTLFFIFIFLQLCVYGQTKMDTVYFTSKWVRTEYPKIVAFYGLKDYDQNGKGMATYYHKSGILHSHQMENNNLKDGKCIWYYKNGNKKSEGDYKDDKPIGDQLSYNEEGKLTEINEWNNGKVSLTHVFDTETGKELDRSKYIAEFPDQEAEFPGGMVGLSNFISQTVIYPKEAILNNEKGKVYVSFVVETDGSISNIVIERGVSYELDKETIRVIEAMPNWTPGSLADGRLARTRCRLPINFTLTDTDKKKKRK